MDDAELVERIRRGDQAAFEQLFQAHKAAIYRYALHMRPRDAAAAEDIVQEVFLAFLRQAEQFNPARGSALAYMLGIARRQVFRQVDRSRTDEPIDEAIAGAASGPDPLEGLTRAETTRRVRQAVAALPPVFREAIVLCEMNELDYAAAAVVIGRPIGTVRSRLHRARTMLRMILRERPQGVMTANG